MRTVATRRAANLVDFQQHIARNDVALTHTIIQPTIDKRTDSAILGNEVTIRKVGETSEGIVVRGSRVLGTLAPFADEQTVYPAIPLPPGAEKYALSFAIPLDTPGLKFLCRDSVVGARCEPLRQAVVVPVRRAGRLLHLRRRGRPVGSDLHRR